MKITLGFALDSLRILPLIISVLLLFLSSIGIFRSQNALQKLHFGTVIDIICVPLALISVITTLGFEHMRVVYCIAIIGFLSPVSSYFLGRAFISQTGDTEDSPNITQDHRG